MIQYRNFQWGILLLIQDTAKLVIDDFWSLSSFSKKYQKNKLFDKKEKQFKAANKK